MHIIRACIFDLDGVVVDTAKYHYDAWRTIAKELGINFTIKQNESLKGISRVDSLDKILDMGRISINKTEKEKYLIKKNEIYLNFVKEMDDSEILPGVKDFILDIKSRGIKIALGSASKNAVKILKEVNLHEYFDAIVDGNSVIYGKPNPEVFLKGAKLLNVNPEETIVFEDAYSGIEAANSGGFIGIGIGSEANLQNASYVLPGFDGVSFDILYAAIDKIEFANQQSFYHFSTQNIDD